MTRMRTSRGKQDVAQITCTKGAAGSNNNNNVRTISGSHQCHGPGGGEHRGVVLLTTADCKEELLAPTKVRVGSEPNDDE